MNQNASNSTAVKRPGVDLHPQSGRRIKKTKAHNPVENPADRTLLNKMSAKLFEDQPLIYSDIESVRSMLSHAEELHRKPLGDCTQPGTQHSADTSFPQNPGQWRVYVQQVMSAIMDWSSYIEWRQVLDRGAKEHYERPLIEKIERHERLKKRNRLPVQEHALVTRDLVSTPEVLPFLGPIERQMTEVLGRTCNAFAAECLAWKLVEAAIESQQGNAHNAPWTNNDGS